jgi:adenosylcobinamide-GDP ribazoletransferase
VRAALSFLTVLPVNRAGTAPGRAALLAFPLAGLTIGALWAAVAWGGTDAWTPLVAAALVVAADLVATGALHVDAVADVADGIASRRPPEEAVRIMREPAVGAVGAAAASTLLLRLALITAVAAAGLPLLLVAIPICGRAAMVMLLATGERPSQPSLAGALGGPATPAVAAAVVLEAAALVALAGLAAAGPQGAGLAAAGLAAGLLTALACERGWHPRFGPITGDLAGATGMAAETVALAVLGLAPALGVA